MPAETTPATGTEDETTETQTAETATTETATPEGAEKPDAVANALAAERQTAKAAKTEARDAKTALAAATDRVTTLESQVTDLTAKLAEADGRVPTLERKLTSYEVVADKGLDLGLAARLNGSTREEMETDAEELAKLVGTSTTAVFDGGARTTAPTKGTPEQEHAKTLASVLRGGSPDPA